MLVVIAMIGILSSILLVVISAVHSMSIRNQCQYNLNQIGVTLNQIMLSNGGAYPLLWDSGGFPWWARVHQEWEGTSTWEGQGVIDTNAAAPGLQMPLELPEAMTLFHCRAAPPLNPAPGEPSMPTRVLNLHNSISYGMNFDVRRYRPDGMGEQYRCSGRATGGSPNSLTDDTNTWIADEYLGNSIRLTSGPSAGESRAVLANTADTIVFAAPPFSSDPEPGTRYEIWNAGYQDLLNRPRALLPLPTDPADGDGYPDLYYYTEIKHPGEFILLSEANVAEWDANGNGTRDWTGGRIGMMASQANETGALLREVAPIVGRHDGWANVLFADLHLELMEAIQGETATRNVNLNTPLWTLPDD